MLHNVPSLPLKKPIQNPSTADLITDDGFQLQSQHRRKVQKQQRRNKPTSHYNKAGIVGVSKNTDIKCGDMSTKSCDIFILNINKHTQENNIVKYMHNNCQIKAHEIE